MPFIKGHPGFKSWLGKKHTKATKKMRLARLKISQCIIKISRKKKRNSYKNKTFAGENSPSWTGGTKHYRGYGWVNAKKERRKIDNYTCQDCGKKEEPGKRALMFTILLNTKTAAQMK